MDPRQENSGGGGQPSAPGPHGTIVPIGDEWADGVKPAVVSSRSRRLRWGIAGAVVLCVALVTAAGIFVLSGAAGAKSLTASVAPKDAVAFLEVRTDLPGDQQTNLADFMSHFPGFEDRAQFGNAMDNLLNKLTGEVSPDLQYTSAFKPWMEGEVSIAVMNTGAFDPGTGYAPPSSVAIFALKDRAAAQTWIAGELARVRAAMASQAYAGTTLYTIGTGADQGAYALTDQDLLLGTVAGVEAALDTKTNGSLADNANYQAAMNSLSGDSLARFYLDPRTVVADQLDASGAILGAIAGALGSPGTSPGATPAISTASLPAWVAGSIRAESNQMVMNLAMPRQTGAGSGNHPSTLASVLPGTTVGVVEIHSIGALLAAPLAKLAGQSRTADGISLQGVQAALTLLGGTDWIGDGVAAVTREGSTYGGGIVIEATDASTASSKMALLNTYAALAGSSLHVTSRDEAYKGVNITVFSIPDSGSGKPVEIAVAAVGDLLVAGYTDSFVKAVVDTTPGTSLASQADYSAVMAAAGSSNEGSAYVDVPALEDQIGQAIMPSSPSMWKLDYKPYFDHVGGVGYAVIDGNTVILRFVVTAK